MTTDKPDRPGAGAWVPAHPTSANLARALQTCRGCELYADATQAVPGAGPDDARVMLVGEAPGDQEDLAGAPFVGPAGKLLVQALDGAGLDRDLVYRTNAVKHFRWESRGSNRLHKTPGRMHIVACQPWLETEVDVVTPEGVVLLGGTAGSAVFGTSFRVGAMRGRRLDWPETFAEREGAWTPDWVIATAHPSSVLRSQDRDADLAALVSDLRVAASLLA